MSETTKLSEQDELYERALEAIFTHDHDALVEVFNDRLDANYRPPTKLPWDSLLSKAIHSENIDAIDMLLAAGAGKETPQDQHLTLVTACDGDNETILHMLMEAGFSTTNMSPNGPHHVVLDEYNAMPNVSLSHEPENLKSRLFKKGVNGDAPLDNPRVWHNFGAIAEVLEGQGTPITKDDLFNLNSDGEPWLNVAIKCRAFDAVQKHLRTQDDAFTLKDIRQEEGMMELLAMKGGLKSLFTYEMLAPEGGEKALRQLLNEVPQDSLWQVRNLSQLRQEMRPLSSQHSGIGR